MDLSKLNDILGDMNPTDPRVGPAMKFLEKLIEKKKDSGCVIF
jgi:hypothetical protein